MPFLKHSGPPAPLGNSFHHACSVPGLVLVNTGPAWKEHSVSTQRLPGCGCCSPTASCREVPSLVPPHCPAVGWSPSQETAQLGPGQRLSAYPLASSQSPERPVLGSRCPAWDPSPIAGKLWGNLLTTWAQGETRAEAPVAQARAGPVCRKQGEGRARAGSGQVANGTNCLPIQGAAVPAASPAGLPGGWHSTHRHWTCSVLPWSSQSKGCRTTLGWADPQVHFLVTSPPGGRLVPPGLSRPLLPCSPFQRSQLLLHQGHCSTERGPRMSGGRGASDGGGRCACLSRSQPGVHPPPPSTLSPQPLLSQSKNPRKAELEASHVILLGTQRSQVGS